MSTRVYLWTAGDATGIAVVDLHRGSTPDEARDRAMARAAEHLPPGGEGTIPGVRVTEAMRSTDSGLEQCYQHTGGTWTARRRADGAVSWHLATREVTAATAVT